MQDRPTASELLVAVGEFLEHEVLPLGGRVGYHGRVAGNVVEMVRREIEQAPRADAEERAGLADLLGGPTDAEVSSSLDVEDLVAANTELAGRIRDGSLDARREDVLAHLRRTSATKLAIANPRELELWSSTASHDKETKR